jgi:hypothetical protein
VYPSFRTDKHMCLELSEDWLCNEEPVCDGITFFVKYLGSVLVEASSGEEVTAEAIKNIITMVSIDKGTSPRDLGSPQ